MSSVTVDTRLILVVDDDANLASELADCVNDAGMQAIVAHDFDSACRMAAEANPDLVLLDQRLGRVDTLARLQEVRSVCGAPIVFLTGNRSEVDRILGLELGADDFLLKPISTRELIARIRVHLRRSSAGEAGSQAAAAPARPSLPGIGAWRLCPVENRLFRPDGTPVPLTLLEFRLLAILAATPGEACGRDDLSERVLGRRPWSGDRALDNLVHRIRKKIERAGDPAVVSAVRGQGYTFRGFPPV